MRFSSTLIAYELIIQHYQNCHTNIVQQLNKISIKIVIIIINKRASILYLHAYINIKRKNTKTSIHHLQYHNKCLSREYSINARYISFHSRANFMRRDPVLFKGLNGDTGPTHRGLLENFNIQCDGASTRDNSPPLYGRTEMKNPK